MVVRLEKALRSDSAPHSRSLPRPQRCSSFASLSLHCRSFKFPFPPDLSPPRDHLYKMHVDPASPLTLKMWPATIRPRETFLAGGGDESFELSRRVRRPSFESPTKMLSEHKHAQVLHSARKTVGSKTARFFLGFDGLAIIFFALLTWRFLLYSPRDTDVSGLQAKSSTDSYFLDLWVKHVTDHPVRARDRTGFSEMGLRTSMYAHLLADPSLPDFEDYERKLWPFIPGIASLRRSYFEGARYASEKRPKTRGIVMSLGKNDFDFAVQVSVPDERAPRRRRRYAS